MICVFNDKLFDTAIPQIVGDVQYPAHWFDDAGVRAAAGIVDVANTEPPVVAGNQQAIAEVLGDGQGGWHVVWTVVDRPIPVPQSVTRRQARQALLIRGLLDKIEPAIQAIPDATQRDLALIEWQDSLNFERHRPLVVQIGLAVGLDQAGLDELFIFAATL